MPPALLDEGRNLGLGPDEIRFAKHRPLRSVAFEVAAALQFFHALSGASIAARTHRRHDLRSHFGRDFLLARSIGRQVVGLDLIGVACGVCPVLSRLPLRTGQQR